MGKSIKKEKQFMFRLIVTFISIVLLNAQGNASFELYIIGTTNVNGETDPCG